MKMASSIMYDAALAVAFFNGLLPPLSTSTIAHGVAGWKEVGPEKTVLLP